MFAVILKTKIKTHYNRHLKTKKHQNKVNSGGSKSIISEPEIYQNSIEENNIDDEIVCEYCDKNFSSLSHLSRHKKKNCKIKLEQEKQKKELAELKQMIKDERERHQ